MGMTAAELERRMSSRELTDRIALAKIKAKEMERAAKRRGR
jgi:hypothetical protein